MRLCLHAGCSEESAPKHAIIYKSSLGGDDGVVQGMRQRRAGESQFRRSQRKHECLLEGHSVCMERCEPWHERAAKGHPACVIEE